MHGTHGKHGTHERTYARIAKVTVVVAMRHSDGNHVNKFDPPKKIKKSKENNAVEVMYKLVFQ